MKKMLCLFLVIAFCLVVSQADAKIKNPNVDIKEGGFQYKVAYHFATQDIAASLSATEIPIVGGIEALGPIQTTGSSLYYTMPFKGRIVAISIAANAALTGGSATAEVTINGQLTGVRTAVDYNGTSLRQTSGEKTAHAQWNYRTIEYDNDRPDNWGGGQHTANDYDYGKATQLAAGDRIGAKLSTDANFTVANTDFVVTVIVLQ